MKGKFENTLNNLYNDIIGEMRMHERKSWHHYGSDVVNSNGWTRCRYSKYATTDRGEIVENPEAGGEPQYNGFGFDWKTKDFKEACFPYWIGVSQRWRDGSKPIPPNYGFFVNMYKYVEQFKESILTKISEDAYDKLLLWILDNGLDTDINIGSAKTRDLLIKNFGSHSPVDNYVDHNDIMTVIWLPYMKEKPDTSINPKDPAQAERDKARILLKSKGNSYTFSLENYLAISRFPELFQKEVETVKNAYLLLDPFLKDTGFSNETVFERNPFFLKIAIMQHVDLRYVMGEPKSSFANDEVDGHPMCEFLKIITENDKYPLNKSL